MFKKFFPDTQIYQTVMNLSIVLALLLTFLAIKRNKERIRVLQTNTEKLIKNEGHLKTSIEWISNNVPVHSHYKF